MYIDCIPPYYNGLPRDRDALQTCRHSLYFVNVIRINGWVASGVVSEEPGPADNLPVLLKQIIIWRYNGIHNRRINKLFFRRFFFTFNGVFHSTYYHTPVTGNFPLKVRPITKQWYYRNETRWWLVATNVQFMKFGLKFCKFPFLRIRASSAFPDL